MAALVTRSRQPRATYAGPDRRARTAATGSTLGFVALAAFMQVAIVVLAWSIGAGRLEVSGDIRALEVAITAAAAAILGSAAAIAVARFAHARDRISLDVGVIMLVSAGGWFLPLRLVPTLGSDWGAFGGALALAAAGTALVFTVLVVVQPIIDLRLPISMRLGVAAGALAAFPVIAALAGWEFEDELLRRVTIPVLGLAAVVAFAGGILRHRWLVAFLGLQFLGLQAAEVLALRGAEGEPGSWAVGAAMVSATAAAMGLYGVVIDVRQAFIGDQRQLSETWTALKETQRRAADERRRNQDRMHSLRSGLLGVEVMASSLASAPDPAEVGEVLAMEVHRLRELTSKTRLTLSTFDLRDALNSLVEFQLRRGLPVTLDAPRGLIVTAAKAETIDAVHCLIDNAIRHAPSSPIMVSAGYSAVDLDALEIRVRDRGPGVPVKMQEKIFRRGVTTHREGTGIGLHVARMIAEAQGGELSYRARLGGGSEFVLRLPVEPVGSKGMFE